MLNVIHDFIDIYLISLSLSISLSTMLNEVMKGLIESCQQIPLEMDMVATKAADQQCKVGNNKNTVG